MNQERLGCVGLKVIQCDKDGEYGESNRAMRDSGV